MITEADLETLNTLIDNSTYNTQMKERLRVRAAELTTEEELIVAKMALLQKYRSRYLVSLTESQKQEK